MTSPARNVSVYVGLLAAADFAAHKHRAQRRKDASTTPYINHPIRVALLLAQIAEINDLATLQAALLHDTLEDTSTTPQELENHFGAEVRALVQEVSDDKCLPSSERKRLQIAHAPNLSPKARFIKLADKVANVSDLTWEAPVTWPIQRKLAYLDWAEKVVGALQGCNQALEQMFARLVAEKRKQFSSPPSGC